MGRFPRVPPAADTGSVPPFLTAVFDFSFLDLAPQVRPRTWREMCPPAKEKREDRGGEGTEQFSASTAPPSGSSSIRNEGEQMVNVRSWLSRENVLTYSIAMSTAPMDSAGIGSESLKSGLTCASISQDNLSRILFPSWLTTFTRNTLPRDRFPIPPMRTELTVPLVGS